MRGEIFQRIFKAGDPTAGLSARELNGLDEVLSNMEVQPGHMERQGNQWTIVIDELYSDNSVGTFPFKITVSGSAVRVRQGNYTRFGTKLALAPDASQTYKTVGSSWSNSTIYFVYLQLNSATNDPALVPSSVTVHAATSVPVDTGEPGGNVYWELGTFLTNGSGVPTTIVQEWQGGDIDNIAYVPDSLGQASDGTDYQYFSIGRRAVGALHIGNSQIYEWDGPTEVTAVADDLFMFRDDSDTSKHLRYTDVVNLGTSIVNNYTSATWNLIGDTVITYINGGGGGTGVKHEPLDFSNTDENELGVGRSVGNTDHDDVYWRGYDDGSGRTGHDSFVDSKAFHTSKAVVASDGAGALVLTAGGLYAAAGVYSDKGSSAQAGFFGDGTRSAYLADGTQAGNFTSGTLAATLSGGGVAGAFVDGTRECYLADGAWAVFAEVGSINVGTGYDYYHVGVQGYTGTVQVTVAGVTKDMTISGGIITGVA